MFTVTLINKIVFVEKDYKNYDYIPCTTCNEALAHYFAITAYYDVQGLLTPDSSIVE